MLKIVKFGGSSLASAEQFARVKAIVEADPDYIFITCMGDFEEGKAQMESNFSSNPIWDTLQAVKNGRCFYLEKELFHYKPNARWGESYEVLAQLLADN